MLKWVLGLALLATGLVAWGQPAPAAPAAPAPPPPPPVVVTTLVTNPDFSLDKDGDKWPDEWPHEKWMSWGQEGDVHYLRMTSEKPGETYLLYKRIYLPNPRPAALEIRMRVRYTDIQHGKESWYDARFFGHFKDDKDKVVRPEPGGFPTFQGTSKGWVDTTTVIRVPKTAAYLELMPVLFNVASGSLDLSFVQAYPASAYLIPVPPVVASTPWVKEKDAVLPPELHVDGAELKTPDGKPVWLQGLCLDSLEWSAGGEKLDKSLPVAIEGWHSNVIRLPVTENFWFGRGPWQANDGGVGYRKIVDTVIAEAAKRGAYVVLDYHSFGTPGPEAVAFWRDAAVRYKNHPGVIYELLNEPIPADWKEWRDGGLLTRDDLLNRANDEVFDSPGMQGLLDTVRSTGAHNVVVAGGIGWGYELAGLNDGYALTERADGHGIMYSSHLYPWAKNWEKCLVPVLGKYCIFSGEVGSPPLDWKGFDFIKPEWRIPDVGDWPNDAIGLIQKYKINWTGFSFHPSCGPCAISDWDYTPTPYWGAFVKDALAGKQFVIKKMR